MKDCGDCDFFVSLSVYNNLKITANYIVSFLIYSITVVLTKSYLSSILFENGNTMSAKMDKFFLFVFLIKSNNS